MLVNVRTADSLVLIAALDFPPVILMEALLLTRFSA